MTIESAAPPRVRVDYLIERYSVLLFDAYGVLLHSLGTLPGAGELIARLNETKKPYYVLTNDASSLPESSAERYQSFGLAIASRRIITSGSLIAEHFDKHSLQGAACAVIGPQDSVRYVEQSGGNLVGLDDPFEVLVIGDQSGLTHRDTANIALNTLLTQLDHGQDVHLVLPNPDLAYPSGTSLNFASGSVALMFEAVLELRFPGRPDLRFHRLGKPEAPIFEEATRRSGTTDMVMIGDQPITDIRGARSFGIDAALVSTGVAITADSYGCDRPDFLLESLELGG